MESNNLDLYNKLRIVPQEAKKEIIGGRLKGMTDINPMWRIKTLTDNFGMCGFGWKYEVTDKRLEKGCNDEISAFVQVSLFVKVNEIWSDAIVGLGGASFVAKEKNGMYQSDECFKMALTDAISIACKALGMGADVYFQKDRTKYDQEIASTATLSEAVNEMNEVTSYEGMIKVWDKYSQFKKETEFATACTNAGRKYPKNK